MGATARLIIVNYLSIRYDRQLVHPIATCHERPFISPHMDTIARGRAKQPDAFIAALRDGCGVAHLITYH